MQVFRYMYGIWDDYEKEMEEMAVKYNLFAAGMFVKVMRNMDEIEKLKECFVEELLPVQIYLFGSYANNSAMRS